MSSKLGVNKPDELMYTTALEELRIKPEEAIFIDDNGRNVEGAKVLGIEGILMDRKMYSIANEKNHKIANLSELQCILK
jgi:putative hydrolase of the HAD superfamily